MSRIASPLILAAIALASATSAHAQVVTNGSFDDGENGWTLNAPWQGWVKTSSMQSSGAPITASPADVGSVTQNLWHTYYLNADPYNEVVPGGYRAISQQISGLTINKTYALSFYQAASNNSSEYEPTSLWWQVKFGSQSADSAQFAAPAAHAATGWQRVTMLFTAASVQQTLTFLAHASTPVAPEPQLLLDGVRIAAVPEPAGWALGMAGLAALGWLSRRRRNR